TELKAAGAEASRTGLPLLIQFTAPACGASARMLGETYADPGLVRFLAAAVIPVRADSVRDADLARRFDVRWTPVAFLALFEASSGFSILRILTGCYAPAELEAAVRDALAAHRRIAELAPAGRQDVLAQAELAELCWAEQRFQAATTAWLAVLEYDAEDRHGRLKPALLGLCRAYIAAGAEGDEVFAASLKEHLERLLALDPGNAVRHRTALALQQGYRLFGTRRYAAAAVALAEIAAAAPNSEAAPEALYWLGAAHALEERPGEFATAWNRLMTAYPDSVWARRASWAPRGR
ncbi:MAG: thioredoxin family protein, partial [Planctomycetes bacterium]|nr:thioredoxin family protein [Planctomycetota bacterium]